MKRVFSLILAFVFLAAATRPAFAQSAPSPPPAGIVRVNFRSPKGPATIYDRANGRLLCTTPCTADVPIGAPLRVTLEGGEDEPHDFAVTADSGSMANIEIKRGGTGALVGGIVMASIGGLLVITGLVFIGLAEALEDGSVFYEDLSETYRTVGIVQLVAGIGVGVGGLVLLANRTNEATTKQKPSSASRTDILRGDLAAAGARDPMIMPARQQLGWTFAF
jgi:hypothetical protein